MHMTTLTETVTHLKSEARERWGDRWTVEVKHFADGDFHAHAVHSRGRTGGGNLEEDRLFITDDSTVCVERVTLERRELDSEIVGAPTPRR